MKLLQFNVALVVLTLHGSTGFAQVVDDNADLREIIRSLQERMTRVEEENAELRRFLNDAVGSWTTEKQTTVDSMFLATISRVAVDISPGDPIIWDSAPINPGGHFNTILGMYTAPVHGYYQFSVAKEGNDYYGSFYFLVDEVRYAYEDEYTGSNSTPTGTATINIELTAGQIVRIENRGSSKIGGTDSTGTMLSWFTGHLLYPL